MTNQELFEAIAGYMPYDLKFYHKRMDNEATQLLTLQSASLIGGKLDFMFGDGINDENIIWMSDLIPSIQIDMFETWVKPILRPLPDLTNPCLEGGKVPIVEIAKRLFGVGKESEYRYYIQGDNAECCVSYHNAGKPDSMQGFFINIKHPDMNSHRVVKELYRFHLDVEDLIEKGHAIDINTLSNDLKKL